MIYAPRSRPRRPWDSNFELAGWADLFVAQHDGSRDGDLCESSVQVEGIVVRLLQLEVVAEARREREVSTAAPPERPRTVCSSSPDDPRICVFEDPSEGWQAEIDEQTRAIRDGEVLVVDESSWMLHLPLALEQTFESAAQPLRLDTLRLRFGVCSDEEDVELVAIEGEHRLKLSPRHYQHLLLLLARARLEDAALPDVGLSPPTQQSYLEQPCCLVIFVAHHGCADCPVSVAVRDDLAMERFPRARCGPRYRV